MKNVILFLCFGSTYAAIEFIWRTFTNGGINITQTISMAVVGGVGGLLVGKLNEKYKLSILSMSWLSALILSTIELVAGLILNKGLGLNIWDYSNEQFNLFGQICLLYVFLWFMLSPFAIWFDDFLRHKMFNKRKPMSLFKHYKKLFTSK